MGIYFFMVFADTCIIPKCFKPVRNQYNKIKAKIFWNSVLRALIEQYMPITIAAFQSIQKGTNWDNFETSLNSVSNFLFIPYIIGYPFWIVFFLKRNRF